MMLILFYLSILVWQLFLASFSMSISPYIFLKEEADFFSLNFFSTCWWIVLKTINPQGIPKTHALLAMRSRWKSQRGARGTHHRLACLPHPYPVHLTCSFLWRWSQAVELEELQFDHDDNDHSMAKITMSGLPKRLWLALSPMGCLFLDLHDLEVTYVVETQVILFCFWGGILLMSCWILLVGHFINAPRLFENCVYVCACSVVTDSFCDPMDCSPPGSFVCGISQVRILERVALSFSKGSSWPRDQSGVFCVSCLAKWILHQWATCVVSNFQIQSVSH